MLTTTTILVRNILIQFIRKQALNDDHIELVLDELGMFHDWLSEKLFISSIGRKRVLSDETIKFILGLILDRAEVKYEEYDLLRLLKMHLSQPLEYFTYKRNLVDFDSTVAEFCKEINLIFVDY